MMNVYFRLSMYRPSALEPISSYSHSTYLSSYCRFRPLYLLLFVLISWILRKGTFEQPLSNLHKGFITPLKSQLPLTGALKRNKVRKAMHHAPHHPPSIFSNLKTILPIFPTRPIQPARSMMISCSSRHNISYSAPMKNSHLGNM